MIRLTFEITKATGNNEQSASTYQKVYEPMTGYLEMMKDLEKTVKAFYGIKEETQVADDTGN